jgi:membrane protease YdiL (CAAX protease family)
VTGPSVLFALPGEGLGGCCDAALMLGVLGCGAGGVRVGSGRPSAIMAVHSNFNLYHGFRGLPYRICPTSRALLCTL